MYYDIFHLFTHSYTFETKISHAAFLEIHNIIYKSKHQCWRTLVHTK